MMSRPGIHERIRTMPRTFAAFLADLGRGQTAERLAEALAETCQAVEETGKAGSLSLRLTVKANGDGSVTVEDQITTKIPDAERGKTIFFVHGDGDLSRTDPRQPDLPHIHRIEEGNKK